MFSTEEINSAKQYKYNGIDESIFAKLFLRKYWDSCMKFIPMTVAPNTITLIGFLFEVFSFVLSYVYSDGLKKELPWFVCFLNGICLFVYQTLDNLDGRQARRTKMSSPLGQFFDHGCDAITGVCEIMKIAATYNMGCELKTFILLMLLGTGFFLASYEEYVTHRFYLGKINAPDEGLLLLSISHIVVSFFPSLKHYFTTSIASYLILITFSVTIAMIIFNVLKSSIHSLQTFIRGVVAIIPCLISASVFSFIVYKNPEIVQNKFFLMSSGFLLQYGSQMLIVSHVVKRSAWRLFDLSTLLMWGSALLYFVPQLNAKEYFWNVYFAAIIFTILVFDLRVIHGLSKGLGIPVFRVVGSTASPSRTTPSINHIKLFKQKIDDTIRRFRAVAH